MWESKKISTFAAVNPQYIRNFMEEERIFEEMYRTINTSEISVLRNVHRFPVYGKDIISPCMMVCINHSGTARVLYDMQEVVFRPHEIAVVLPNHILRPLESSPDYCVTLIVHSAALGEELKTKRFTHDAYKFHSIPSCPVNDDEMEQFMKAVDILEHLCNASLQRYPLRHEMLIAQTNVMTEMLNAFRREIDEKSKNDSYKHSVFCEFCELVAMHYREQHEALFYAEKLHLSPRYFSVLIKEIIGVSASDYIEEYILTQAKNILATRQNLSVQQISYMLGFAESPSFCRFFKRHTGVTPNGFRKEG